MSFPHAEFEIWLKINLEKVGRLPDRNAVDISYEVAPLN